MGRYQLREEIARGGMGAVYRAYDPTRDVEVALKVLSGLQPSDRMARRLHREANALTRLRHPHIVAVHEIAADQGCAFLALDLIEGEDLQARIERQGPLGSREAAELALPLAQALAYAHQSGVLHRDLKPANVLLDRSGKPRLADFGLAKDLDTERSQLTQSGQLMGTPGYWPPEQARGQLDEVGPRSDVYGLGATLYAALTGRPPVGGKTMQELIVATVEAKPTPPSRLGLDVDRDLERICMRCLAKDPADRYPSASALGTDLERYLNGESLAGAAPPPATAAPPGPLLAGLAAAAVVCGVAVVFVAGRDTSTPSDPPVAEQPADPVRAEPVEGEPDRTVSPEAPLRTEPEPEPPQSPPRRDVSEVDQEAAGRYTRDALGLAQEQRFEEALEDLDRALALDPNHLEALAHRGKIRAGLGQAGGLADLERAKALAPDTPKVLALLASAKRDLDDLDGALVELDRAIELDPDYVEALILRGQIHAQRKNHEQAHTDFNLAKNKAEKYSREYFVAKQLKDQQKRILKHLRGED